MRRAPLSQEGARGALLSASYDLVDFDIARAAGPRRVIRGEALKGDITLDSGHTTFENCLIEGGGHGIHVMGDASLTVKSCEIRNVTMSGVHVTSTGRVQVVHSHIHHCGENGVRAVPPGARNTRMGTRLLVKGCDIHDIAAPWGDGPTGNCIFASRSDNAQFIGNRCVRATYSAIRVADSANVSMIGNYCDTHSNDAHVYYEFSFYGGIVAYNYFTNGLGGLAITNFLSGVGGHRYDGRQATVIGNRFTNYRTFAAKAEADALFAHNVIDGSATWGVWAGFGASVRNVQLTDNLIMNCRWGVGLPIMKTSPVEVRGNTFVNVDTPIAGLVPDWDVIAERRAAQPLSPQATHIIKDNLVSAN